MRPRNAIGRDSGQRPQAGHFRAGTGVGLRGWWPCRLCSISISISILMQVGAYQLLIKAMAAIREDK
jgi:hypothetical protein